MNLSLLHIESGSEIPDGFETRHDQTEIVTRTLSNTEKVMECLQDAGGDSLTTEEISESTDLDEVTVRSICERLCRKGTEETREVFRDENAEDSFFLCAPLLDSLYIGA